MFRRFLRLGRRFAREGSRRRPARHQRLLNRRHLRAEPLEDRRLLSVSVGDLVWNDLDANGLQDPGEPGVAGAVVEIFSSTDGTVGNADDVSCGVAITDAEGHYSLGDLTEGIDYYLAFRPPVGYGFTLQGQGDDAVDSDADAVGRTGLFTVAANQSDTRLDAGLVGAAPGFGFALGAGGTGSDKGQSIATDSAGNVYLTGTFSGEVDFDPGPGSYPLTGVASNRVFVAKYTPAGALIWTRGMDGTIDDKGRGIVVAADGSVYTTGYFQGTADFDPGLGFVPLTSAGGQDVFVLKLNSAGNFVWARSLGGTDSRAIAP